MKNNNLFYSIDTYLRKQYSKIHSTLTFLPANPLTHLPFGNKILKIRYQNELHNFQPDIKKGILFGIFNSFMLEGINDLKTLGEYLNFIKLTENVDGDILELGTYKGSTTIIITNLLKIIKSKKIIYTCDAFIGLPTDDNFSSTKNAKGKFSDTSYEKVMFKIKQFNFYEKIIVIKGLFEDTLNIKLNDKKFSFILLDCDTYDSTKNSIQFLWDHLSIGGVICFDDYERETTKNLPTWGETKAVNEFCHINNLIINMFPIPHLTKCI